MGYSEQFGILIAIESFYDGGAEMFAIRLANEICKYQKVVFVELYPYKSKPKKQRSLLNDRKINVVQAGKNVVGYILTQNLVRGRLRETLQSYYSRRKKRELVSVIKDNNIKIVHSHSWETDLYFARLKQVTSFKLIASLHGHYEFLPTEVNNFETRTQAIIPGIDKFVYLSKRHTETLDRFNIGADKRVKIFYGLDRVADSETVYEKGSLLKLIFIARGIAEKGWQETIDAYKLLSKKYPGRIELTMIGESDYVKQMKMKNQSEGLVFLGYQQDVFPYIRSADLALHPSYFAGESLPNVIIEYLSCGKPVIATDVGATTEMLSVGGHIAGQLLETGNNGIERDKLAWAIEQYIINPGLLEEHSKMALKASEKFSMESCVESYLNEYKNLLC